MIVRLLQHGCTCCSFVASGEAVLPVAEFAMAGGSQNSKIARSWGQQQCGKGRAHLCDHARGVQTDAHEEYHIWVPDG